MISIRATCDECGEKHISSPGFNDRENWIEVWMSGEINDNVCLDFCTQTCLVDYFTKEEANG